jgi:predicted membrane-bound mannosyltransferase
MRENKLNRFAPALLVALLAAVLRFHDLGAWPYSGDETASLHEEDVLFHGVQVPHDSQAYRLPHLIPLSYLALHVSHVLFGSDEWGTRVVVALLGVLSVVLVYWLLDGPLSRTVAIVAAVLVALLPQHVMHSQETRFYMVAAFFSFATLLTGARILQSHGTFYAVLSAGAALAAVLTHTLLLVLLPLVFVAVYTAGRRAAASQHHSIVARAPRRSLHGSPRQLQLQLIRKRILCRLQPVGGRRRCPQGSKVFLSHIARTVA